MRPYILTLIIVFSTALVFGTETPVEIHMLDGSSVKGKVLSSTASEITLSSDLGVLRLGMDRMKPESRKMVSEMFKPDTDALKNRIAELEAKVAQLQSENEALRKRFISTTSSVQSGAANKAAGPSQGSQQGEVPKYSISLSGKRHNSDCRYFGSGKACGPTDGTPCKICGG